MTDTAISNSHTGLQSLANAAGPLTLSGVSAGAMGLLLGDLARGSKAGCCFIAPDDAGMEALADIAGFYAPDIEVTTVPAWDCLPYDRSSPSLAITARRMAALHALQQPAKSPRLVLTTINAASQRCLTPFRVRAFALKLVKGMEIARETLIEKLQLQGYVRSDTVADAGEYALRGNIVDIFPSHSEQGIRLDFFGDELDSLRIFDPASQRSSGTLEQLTLLPASEMLMDAESIKRFRSRYRAQFGAEATGDPLYQSISEGRRISGMEHWLPMLEEQMVTLFDHLAPDSLILMDQAARAVFEQRIEAITDYHANRQRALVEKSGHYRPLAPDALYLSDAQWSELRRQHKLHLVTPFEQPQSASNVALNLLPARDFAPERARGDNVYKAAVEHIRSQRAKGTGVIIACYSQGSRSRLAGLLGDHGLSEPLMAESWDEAQQAAHAGKTVMVILPQAHGFATGELELLSEQDLLGDRLVRKKRKSKSADAFLAELATLSTGDLVVHQDHGIGRYEGLVSIPVGDSPHDCVALSYAGGDKLYVPVENMDVLSRYGAESEGVSLDRLGGEAWQRRKAKLKDRIRAIAHELMKTAALRALRKADNLSAEAHVYAEFANRFPWQETEDQERVIAEVLEDLTSGKPMDRLVCGDVGFGKTEVAMRAAFVAAMSGRQVAVIAPTTLLARQHYENFSERFHGLPLKIGRLSRLVPAAEAKATKAALADGTMDIVIGTHALLSKNISFKRLGLVVVDEEQRFGVTHKERLKTLKTDVHMLTLTATPIPRTLQMAMTGLRDLSVIQTPPVDRLAIRTYVMPHDPLVIREALLREHYRGGQSFYVAPRISDLDSIAEFLRENIPEISFIIAHGQMTPTQVEERMSAFYERKYDVLLATTIVESGLDIPSANTMIIHRADYFGLAQLYQLRGRVGRAKVRAYAYLTIDEDGALTQTAEKRLKVMGDLDSLGAGFQLASHDLDIRGAGNLVGDEQSGHIREVGFELYQAMLEEAILAARAESAGLVASQEKFSPQITVDAPIMIPDDYVPDLPLRMALYRRLNDVDDKAALEALAAEIIDRFGPLPDPLANLVRLIEVKINCIHACVAKMEVGARGALVSFHNDSFPDVPGLLAYVERLKGVAKLRPDNRLMISRVWRDPASRLNGLIQLSRGLRNILRKKKDK